MLAPFLLPSLKTVFDHPYTILLASLYPPTTACPASVDHPFAILFTIFFLFLYHPCTIFVPPFTTPCAPSMHHLWTILFTYSPSLRHHRTISFYHPSSIIWPSLHHPSTIFVPSCYHLLGWLFLVLGWQPMFVNALTWTTSGGKKRENQQSRRLYGWYHFPAPKLLKINTFTRTILSTEKVWGSDFQFWSIVNCIRRLEFRMAFAKLKWKHTNQNTKDFQQKLIQ